MKNLETILEMHWSGVFGEAILHSLWQGAIIFIAYWFVNRSVRDNSKLKVNVGIAALLLQFIVSIGTVIYLHSEKLGSVAANSSLQAIAQKLNFTEKYAPWVFCGWIAGFVFLLVKYGASVFYLQWLKKSGLPEISEKLTTAIRNVKEKIGFSIEGVRISESAKVETALVLGYFKPIILVPLALVSQLSLKQLEVILAHEIAHIRRQDFIINMFYTFVEILFFYHPVYWLIGKEVRESREHACDALAAEWTGEGLLLAKTLAQIEDIRFTRSLAMAFGKPTLTRIQRLLGQKTESYQSRMVGLGIMFLVLFSLAFTPVQKEKLIVEKKVITDNHNVIQTDTSIVTKTESTFSTSGNDDKIKIKTKNHDVKITKDGIVLNGKKIVLTPEQQKEFDKNWEAMKFNEEELSEASNAIGLESEKIGEMYAKVNLEMQVSPTEDPNFKANMEKINENAELISREAQLMSEKITKINVNDKEYHSKVEKITREFDQKTKQYEKEMRELEPKMEQFEKRVEAHQIELEKMMEGPIKDIEARLELKEKDMEKVANKYEQSHDAILKFLPSDVRNEIGDHNYAPPRPPSPPSPSRTVVSPPKPPNPTRLKVPAPPPPIPDGPKKNN